MSESMTLFGDPDEVALLAARAFGQELLDAVDCELVRLAAPRTTLRGLLLELRDRVVTEMETQ